MFFLNFEKWQNFRQQIQQVIIAGHTTAPYMFPTVSQFLPFKCKSKLWEVIFNPTKSLIITHADFKIGPKPTMTALRRDIDTALTINETSQIRQISAFTHNAIICPLADIVKPDRER